MGETAILEHGAAYAAEVAACVAERLKTLGHPAEMLTPGALDALVVQAGGSIPRLRAALTSAIFLAATEDSPQIGRDHVERAVAQTGADTVLRAAPDYRFGAVAGPGRRAGILAIGVGGVAAAIIAMAAIGHGMLSRRMDPAPQAAAVAHVASPPAPEPVDAAPPAPVAGAVAPATAPAPVVPKLPPAISVSTPPLPPLAPPLAASVPRPMPSGPTTIVLRYRSGDRWARDKLKAASMQLRRAGYSRIYALPWHGANPPAPVTYFYNQDSDAARAVNAVVARARLLGGPAWWRNQGASLSAGPAGLDRHKPGTIETMLP